VAGGRARNRAACETDEQVRAHGRNLLPQRLHLRSRGQPLCLSRGKELRKSRRAFSTPREGVAKDGAIRYRAAQHDCDACMLKPKCCPNMPARKSARSVHEAARDRARAIAKTEAYAVSRRERKKVEMLFAHLKRILRLDRLRLRGPSGAKDEFLLAATAQTSPETGEAHPAPCADPRHIRPRGSNPPH
jgi:hypothetical protein